ncbi:hypothetical protein BKA58DRAFT_401224 [Alternaria rosae]|uniref:uncharacterized protein n=1 Tax=Alternaria rosae TaxID=1187941 RepID=UPI001E8CBD59|nr:uncharacterized protein BKA58DRAFT_401224 [Alternaria rosae]KAH6873077.1 hypothetical protein BKA58DRAFT_401224 [Alternaria rosae]
MLLRHFFYSLSLYLAVPALSIPKYDNQLLLVQEHELGQSQSTDVVLAIKESGSNAVHQIEIPLRTKVFPALPNRPSAIQVMAATEQGRSVSRARLGRIICGVTPNISTEEREAFD